MSRRTPTDIRGVLRSMVALYRQRHGASWNEAFDEVTAQCAHFATVYRSFAAFKKDVERHCRELSHDSLDSSEISDLFEEASAYMVGGAPDPPEQEPAPERRPRLGLSDSLLPLVDADHQLRRDTLESYRRLVLSREDYWLAFLRHYDRMLNRT